MDIRAGDQVIVTDRAGREFLVEALTGVVAKAPGKTAPVVYVKHSLSNGDFNKVPWPATRVRPDAAS
jgi:hypothetical protein